MLSCISPALRYVVRNLNAVVALSHVFSLLQIPVGALGQCPHCGVRLKVGKIITYALTLRDADLNKEMRAFMKIKGCLGGSLKPSNTVDVGLAILKELRELNKNITHLMYSYRAKVCTFSCLLFACADLGVE
jgi:hypothetical protein